MAAAVQCPNLELNLTMCPCTELSCSRRGICCDCMRFHMQSVEWPRTACMRGTKRPPETLSLPLAVPENCPNYKINLEACPCTYEECERRGKCCACVRNHWKADASSATACMRD